jgi:arginase
MKTVQMLTVNSAQGGPVNTNCLIGQILLKQDKFQKTIDKNQINSHQLFTQTAASKDHCLRILNKAISQFSFTCIKQQQPFIVISGDHSSAMGTWAGVLNSLNPVNRLGLLWLDAHLDAHTYHSSPSANCHGMPVAALLGQADARLSQLYPGSRYFNANNLILLGARSYEPAELRLLNNTSVEIIFANQIGDFKQTFLSSYQKLSQTCTHIGISLDLDIIDPAQAPAVATPVPGGIQTTELLDALTSIPMTGIHGNSNWCGFECSEFIPSADIDQRTLKLLIRLTQIYATHHTVSSTPNKFLGSVSSGTIENSVPI